MSGVAPCMSGVTLLYLIVSTYNSLPIYLLLLIVKIISSLDSTASIQQGFADIICEVSGYAAFSDDTIKWTSSKFAASLDQLDMYSTKYVIAMSTGRYSLIYANGSVGPSITSTLTITQLSFEDEATYICNIGSMRSATYLTVERGITVDFPNGKCQFSTICILHSVVQITEYGA